MFNYVQALFVDCTALHQMKGETRWKCPKIPASYKVSNINKKECANVFC